MAHGFPDWSPIATGSSSELPTYKTSETIPVLVTNNPQYLLSVFNPANSGTDVKLRRLRFTVIDRFQEDAAQTPDILLYRSSTLGTGGTPTIDWQDSSDPPPITQIKYFMTVAPVMIKTVLRIPFGLERKTALQTQRISPIAYYVDAFVYQPTGQLKPFRLRPGEGLGGFIQNHATNMYIGFDLDFTEEPYSP